MKEDDMTRRIRNGIWQVQGASSLWQVSELNLFIVVESVMNPACISGVVWVEWHSPHKIIR